MRSNVPINLPLKLCILFIFLIGFMIVQLPQKFLQGYPKRPLSAYNMFFREERQKVLNLDFQTMGKEISTRWRNTSSEERERFEEMAKEDALRYKNEVQLFEEEQVLANRRKREILDKEQREKLKAAKSSTVPPVGKSTKRKEGAKESQSSSSAAAIAAVSSLRMKEQGQQWQGLAGGQEPALSLLGQAPPHLSLTSLGNNGPPSDALAPIEAAWRQQQINAMLLADERNEMEARALRLRMALGTMPREQQQQMLGLDLTSSQDGLAPVIFERLRRQEEALAALNVRSGLGGMLPSSGSAYPNDLSSSLYGGLGGGGLAGFGSLPASSILQLTGGRTHPPQQISSGSFLERTTMTHGGVPAPTGLNVQLELALSQASPAEKEAFLRSLAQRHSQFP